MLGNSKGGSRHRPKQYVDPHLLFKVLESYSAVVADFGAYEHLSRSSAVDPLALVSLSPFLSALFKVCQEGEVNPKPLRLALMQVLCDAPSLNKSKFNGQVWVNLRAERLCTILYHMRKIARDPEALRICTGKLTSSQMENLKEVLSLFSVVGDHPEARASIYAETIAYRSEDAGSPRKASLAKGSSKRSLSPKDSPKKASSAKGSPKRSLSSKGNPKKASSAKRSATQSPIAQECPKTPRERKVRRVDSDASGISGISLDSQGYPCMLSTPKHEPEPTTPRCSWHTANSDLQAAMGFATMKKAAVMKKPAGAVMKKPEEEHFEAGAVMKKPAGAVMKKPEELSYARAKLILLRQSDNKQWIVSKQRQDAIACMTVSECRRRRFEQFRPDLFELQNCTYIRL